MEYELWAVAVRYRDDTCHGLWWRCDEEEMRGGVVMSFVNISLRSI